jgi:NitT/TauT family transport system substrate-binding protein
MTMQRLLALLGAAAIAFAAHGQTPPRQDVSLRLDWIPSWYQAPFYHALERGYYRDAGLNVSIGQGKGSMLTAQVIASGSETFGFMDLSTMIVAVARGAPLKAIGGVIQRSPDSVITLTTSNIKSPKDLEGKRWGYTAGSASENLFSVFAAKAGVDESKIAKNTMDAGAKITSLLAGRVDFIVSWGATVNPFIVKQGKTPLNILYADYGVNVIARALVTTTGTLSSKPEVVRAFVAATARGMEDSIRDPVMSVDSFIAQQPGLASSRDELVAQMKTYGDFIHSKATAAKPTLWMATEDVASTLDAAKQQLGTTAVSLQANNLFTNDFLPRQ